MGFSVENSHGNVLKHNSASGNGEANFDLRHGSSRNTLSHNVASGGPHGLKIWIDGNDNALTDNTATGSIDCFSMLGGGNTLTGNAADRNSGIGFSDEAVPGANSHADNTCIGNGRGGSEPAALCDDRAP